MTIPQLSEATLRSYANPKSFQRGEDYYQQGAVESLTQRGQLLLATVEGNEIYPYHVSVQFEGDEITSANCTCAYSFDGWCKHIIATLLTCLRQPARIEERPTLEQLLDRLNEVQTQQLLQELVAEYPDLLETIDRLVNRLAVSLAPPQSSQPPRQITIDTAPYRSQVRRILRDAVRYLEEGWEEDPVPEELYDLIGEAQILAEQGDGNNAFAVLEAITGTCAENWDEVEEYGAENDEVAQTLNEIWTEAILVAELTPTEKVDLQTNLESWQDEWNADFAMSLEALRQGWDYPPLQQVLKGEITQLRVWEGESPYYADDLALIRLKILNRQQRYPEYLYLAQAEGQTEQFLTMLARLERIDAVMEAADKQLASMEQALAVARVLLGQGATNEALQIAQRGLILPGNCGYELATWTSKLAEELEEAETALAAKIKAFQAQPSFTDYRKIQTLAGEDWEILKEDLLDYLRSYSDWGLGIESAKVNIFLQEGLIDDAITVVSDLSSYQSNLIHQVMEAAISKHPDWVIENAQRRAESIMDAKKAEHYYHAAEWLRKARAAYYQAGKQAEWSAYRSQLRQTHARKYKLMGLLKQRDLE
ncbi:SWIM zinc finger domain-containing protein [Pleurocapsales cyanobacterium LEGE 06147]|nr:SWIM zinc finger domain-containing protein [Pleurocapsales cyanobacterium LEGE 06147]